MCRRTDEHGQTRMCMHASVTSGERAREAHQGWPPCSMPLAMLSLTTRSASSLSANAMTQGERVSASRAMLTVTTLRAPPACANVSTQKQGTFFHQPRPGSWIPVQGAVLLL